MCQLLNSRNRGDSHRAVCLTFLPEMNNLDYSPLDIEQAVQQHHGSYASKHHAFEEQQGILRDGTWKVACFVEVGELCQE